MNAPQWLKLDHITQRRNLATGDGGIVLCGNTPGTPVTALADGKIIGAGTFFHPDGGPGYGVVAVQCLIPDLGLSDLYYMHIDLEPGIKACKNGRCYGQTVKAGQIIGTINHDLGCMEVGINPPFYGLFGPFPHPGPWVDPEYFLRRLTGQAPRPTTPYTPQDISTATCNTRADRYSACSYRRKYALQS